MGQSERKKLIGFALLILVAVICYWPSLGGTFIWDDPDYVVNNDNLRSSGGLWDIWAKPSTSPQYYPVVFTSFWVEYHLWGLAAVGYKIVNLALHLASAYLVWRVLELLEVPGGFLAACIFALHPVHVESVAWVTERKNTLSTFFYLVAAWAYLKQDRRYWLALIFFLLALFSKTVTASWPAAMLLIVWWKKGRITWGDMKLLLPFFAIALAIAPWTAWLEAHHVGASGTPWNLTWAQKIVIAGRAICFYAMKLIWPVKLAFIYPKWQVDVRHWQWWIWPAVVLNAIAILFAMRKRIGRGPLVGVLFFIGTLVPALGFLKIYPMRYSYVADHFQYLASIGLIALIAAVIESQRHEGRKTDTKRRLVEVGVLAVLAVLTFRQNLIYADKVTLWTDTVEKNPKSWMAWLNLGHAYVERGDYPRSTAAYYKALEMGPNEPEPHFNVGYALSVAEKYPQAIEEYRKAIEVDPNFVGPYYNIGNAYAAMGNKAEAEKYYRLAIEKWPQYPEANYNLALMLEERKDIGEAERRYRMAIEGRPRYAAAHLNLARILWGQGRREDALEHFTMAANSDPNLRPGIERYLNQFGVKLP